MNVQTPWGRVVLSVNIWCRSPQITGCSSPGKTVSIVVRGSNKLVIEEAERSIHDALCVIRCLVKKRSVTPAEFGSQFPLLTDPDSSQTTVFGPSECRHK